LKICFSSRHIHIMFSFPIFILERLCFTKTEPFIVRWTDLSYQACRAKCDSVILGFDSGIKGIDWEFWHLSQPYRNKHPKLVRPRIPAVHIREVRAKERKLVMDDELPFKIFNFNVQIATTMRWNSQKENVSCYKVRQSCGRTTQQY